MKRRYVTLLLALLIALGVACAAGSGEPGDSSEVDNDPDSAESGASDGDEDGDAEGEESDDSSDDEDLSPRPGKDAATSDGPGKPDVAKDAGAGDMPGSDKDASAGSDDDSGDDSDDDADDDAATDESDEEMPASSAGKLPRVTTTDGPGPFTEVVKVKSTPPGGWLIYPKEIGKDGIKHPLFVFGPGGGTTPQTYDQMGMHWDRYGSYGFVIYVLPRSTGDGSAMKAGLDWLIEQNDDASSPLHQKLDVTKICAAGHSQGSVTTFDFMPDDRVTTTIHISGGSFDGMGPSKLSKNTMFLCGPDEVATPQCDGDFENSEVPTYYTKIEGSTHLTSGRLGWPAIIAWLLWHLADQEDQWKKEFVEPTGKFRMGIYKSEIKNW